MRNLYDSPNYPNSILLGCNSQADWAASSNHRCSLHVVPLLATGDFWRIEPIKSNKRVVLELIHDYERCTEWKKSNDLGWLWIFILSHCRDKYIQALELRCTLKGEPKKKVPFLPFCQKDFIFLPEFDVFVLFLSILDIFKHLRPLYYH